MKKLFVIFLLFFISNAFGYINGTQTNACGVLPNKFYAHYTPYSYTCNAGYFLPANTTGCRACPSGYTCSGGTFSFNETISQGAVKNTTITTQNAANSCAANFPHKLVAKFTPKTMNLTWDDAQGNTTTSTCTYDGLITVPPDPEPRPGYVFKGWKVQSTN